MTALNPQMLQEVVAPGAVSSSLHAATPALPATLPVVCFAIGPLYGMAELYVKRLHGMLERHCPQPFVLYCYTDRPLPLPRAIVQRDCTSWTELVRQDMRPTTRKLGLFSPRYVEFERFLYLDLTLVIRRRMDELLTFAWGRREPLVVVSDWHYDGFNSSVMRIQRGTLECIYEAFATGEHFPQRVPGDQDFIRAVVMDRGLQSSVATFPPHQVVSFKRILKLARRDAAAARDSVAQSTIVKFHGHPKMHEAFAWRYRTDRRVNELLHGHWRTVVPIRALRNEWIRAAR
jgi:hypothetical protein